MGEFVKKAMTLPDVSAASASLSLAYVLTTIGWRCAAWQLAISPRAALYGATPARWLASIVPFVTAIVYLQRL